MSHPSFTAPHCFLCLQFTHTNHTTETMSAPTIPPGGTIVDTFKRSFTNVKIDEANDNAIDTSEFLEAVESLVTMFGTKYYT